MNGNDGTGKFLHWPSQHGVATPAPKTFAPFRRLLPAISLVCMFAGLTDVQAAGRKVTPKPDPPPAKFSIVFIDPGHGGADAGGIPGQKVKEKSVALDVAKRLQKELVRRGYVASLTRKDDYSLPKSNRIPSPAARTNAIFVSIHFNSAYRSSARGIETYYNTGTSRPLAAHIHRQLLATHPAENRGIKRAGFYVLRNNPLRAVLVECGFLTNASDATLARKASHREKLARRIAAGISDYRASL